MRQANYSRNVSEPVLVSTRCRFPLLVLLVCAYVTGCASNAPRAPAHELSAEQLTTIISSFLGLGHKELVSFVKGFYRRNNRWPTNAAELKSSIGPKFEMIMPYRDLQILENDAGDCLVSYTSIDNGYEAKITVFRPRSEKKE